MSDWLNICNIDLIYFEELFISWQRTQREWFYVWSVQPRISYTDWHFFLFLMWLRPTKKRYDWDNGTHLLSWLWLFWHAFRDHADPLLLWSEVRTAFMSKTWTFIVKIPSWNHSISEHTRTKFIIKCSPYIFLVFSKLKIKSKLIYISIYSFIFLWTKRSEYSLEIFPTKHFRQLFHTFILLEIWDLINIFFH